MTLPIAEIIRDAFAEGAAGDSAAAEKMSSRLAALWTVDHSCAASLITDSGPDARVHVSEDRDIRGANKFMLVTVEEVHSINPLDPGKPDALVTAVTRYREATPEEAAEIRNGIEEGSFNIQLQHHRYFRN